MVEKGHFYFLRDDYYIDFPDSSLMTNKETVNGSLHGRPCFYAIEDSATGIYWMIPISSRVEKFKSIYNNKIKLYGKCDTIIFAEVLGQERAFLIQNMCPVTESYISSEYKDGSLMSVRISGDSEKLIVKSALKVLALQRNGKKLIFPNVLEIEKQLKNRF